MPCITTTLGALPIPPAWVRGPRPLSLHPPDPWHIPTTHQPIDAKSRPW